MKKFSIIFSLLFIFVVFAEENSPLKDFPREATTYREQSGYANIWGEKFFYYLYDTKGNSDIFYRQYVPKWIDKLGYAIDFENSSYSSPNYFLASTVKALMKQHGCDLSITADIYDGQYRIVVNDYDKDKNIYSTMIYPLIRK